MKSLLVLLLSAASCFAQLGNVSFLASLKPAGVSCNTNCAASVICEKFEQVMGDTWSTNGNDVYSFVNTARSACSPYSLRVTDPTVGDYIQNTNVATASVFVEFWFRLTVNGIPNAGSVDIAQMRTAWSDEFKIAYLRITNNAGTLSIFPDDHVSSTYTPQTITANTWYHIGYEWNNTADTAAWYLSTTDALGSAKDSITGTGTSRSFGDLHIGFPGRIGSFGSYQMDYDSLTVDGTAFSPVEY